jgi:hypothetical protein
MVIGEYAAKRQPQDRPQENWTRRLSTGQSLHGGDGAGSSPNRFPFDPGDILERNAKGEWEEPSPIPHFPSSEMWENRILQVILNGPAPSTDN